jgi:hypothetical protein
VKDIDDKFSSDSVTAIGTCAQRVPAVSGECLKTLIKLLQSKHGELDFTSFNLNLPNGDSIFAQNQLSLRL